MRAIVRWKMIGSPTAWPNTTRSPSWITETACSGVIVCSL